MPNPFSITAATDTVRLDAQGRGSTTFTVSNRSGQLRRGRARLVTSDPGQASWLSVDGEAERNFTADGTQQYTVQVAPPPGSPAGRYTFGLDVVSVENPDEEWSQGPKVSFEIPATPLPKKPFPWWILAVVAALLLVGGVTAWLLTRGHETPPKTTAPPPETPAKATPPEAPSKIAMLGACQQDADCVSGLVCASAVAGQAKQCLGGKGFSVCKASAECATGLSCKDGTCLETGKAGVREACREDPDCGKDLGCIDRHCLGRAGFIGCKAGGDCQGGLTCQQHTCLARLHTACRDRNDCAENLTCVSGQCLGTSGYRGCAGSADCINGTVCSGGRCMGKLGVVCGPAGPCAPGLTCPDAIGMTRCLGSAGYQGCKINSDCAKGLSCQGGFCVVPLGFSCAASSDCAKGITCSGGKCLGPFGTECTGPGTCVEGLECANRRCLKRIGQRCKDRSECASGKCDPFARICL